MLRRCARTAHERPIACASCVAIATTACALASYLGGAMEFQAPSEREWVIARDGITSVADAARMAMKTLDGCARRDESALSRTEREGVERGR